jgi:phage gp46-like protein
MMTTIDIQQGDVYLFQTNDDGDISVENGIVKMNSGLETMAYLCLFGGNEDDDNSQDSALGWWGNVDETAPSREMVSETQHIIDGFPATTENLKILQKAAERDLQPFIDERIASSVTVTVTMVSAKRVSLVVDIDAFGEKSQFNFTENWEFEVR